MRAVLTIAVILAFLGSSLDAEAARKRRRKRKRGGKGTIELITATEGASVYLDGKLWGKTPLKPLKITPATYTVTVKKLGHLEFEQKVQVERKKTATVRAKLLPYAGVLEVSAVASGARLYVDGMERGPLPARLELKAGAHDIVVKADGQEFRERVDAVAGEVLTVTAVFEEESALAAAPTETEVEEDEGGELALAPIAQAPAPAADEDDGLDLVAPTDAPPMEDDGLALVAPSDGASDEAGEDLDLVAPARTPNESPEGDLALVPVNELALTPPSAAVGPQDPLQPGAVSASVPPTKSWYEEWWVWTAGGAAVVAAVATTVVLTSGSSEPEEASADLIWRPEPNPDIGVRPATVLPLP